MRCPTPRPDTIGPVTDRNGAPRTVLAAPDSFKGTAGAAHLAEAVSAGARAAGWESDPCPLSDGGEGFAQVVAARHAGEGAWRTTRVTGPLGVPVEASWWLGVGEAVVESAAASGLPLAGGREGNDPVAATTRGTGELIVAAVGAGAGRVLVGVGGSATTDGGRGALEAIEESGGLGGAEVVVACDVQTRFVDAAEVFGPQKGATPGQVGELRRRLEDFVVELEERYGVDVSALPGGGAAGGLAGGLGATGARLVPGFDVVAEAVGLAGRLRAAQLVVTGEGCLDESSWSGKVVGGVVRLARPVGVPVLVVAGSVVGKVLDPGGVEVRSLTARFGPDQARSDPVGCVERTVREFLAGMPG